MIILIIVQERSRTIDIGPIKDEQNRLVRPREMAVGVRRHRADNNGSTSLHADLRILTI